MVSLERLIIMASFCFKGGSKRALVGVVHSFKVVLSLTVWGIVLTKLAVILTCGGSFHISCWEALTLSISWYTQSLVPFPLQLCILTLPPCNIIKTKEYFVQGNPYIYYVIDYSLLWHYCCCFSHSGYSECSVFLQWLLCTGHLHSTPPIMKSPLTKNRL